MVGDGVGLRRELPEDRRPERIWPAGVAGASGQPWGWFMELGFVSRRPRHAREDEPPVLRGLFRTFALWFTLM
jgi:hypothetical protein